jgi:hypothetical protein
MDNDDGSSNGDRARMFGPRLPAIIPLTRPPVAAPAMRFVLAHWRTILVAALASGMGILGAAVWPYHSKLRDVVTVSLPDPKEASHPGGGMDHTSITSRLNRPVVVIAGETCHAHIPAPRLVVSAPAPVMLRANEPASLGLRADGAPDGAQLVICGFAATSIISAGQSIDEKTWILPVSELADATLLPPRGFAGPMDLDVVLVNADKTVADRRTLRLQWLSQEPAMASLPPSPEKKAPPEVEKQLEEGKRLQAAGNVPMARGIFLRYAQAGHARAAFLYADSFDPISLAKRQLMPDSDPALARIWYRKASDMGSQDANTRLDRLSSW